MDRGTHRASSATAAPGRAGGSALALPLASLPALPLALLLAITLPAATWAQPVPQAAARAASAPSADRAVVRATTSVRVIEDDQIRIEETRVRGQLQRITVAPKGPHGSAMRPYEINVGAGGRDPSQDRSSAGQRVWSVLRF